MVQTESQCVGIAQRGAAETGPVVRLATMDDWWALTRRYPAFRRESHAMLKDFGYMAAMEAFERLGPSRGLEFGHGFNPTLLAAMQDRCEMHGLDGDQSLDYFPTGAAWDALFQERVASQCPRAALHRGFLGDDHPSLDAESFDAIASVSVLEHFDEATLHRVVAHAARLLRPGGVLLGTYDVILKYPEMPQKLIDACRAAGLDIPDLPPPLSADDWPLVLVESPSVVRLTYQGGQPEERAFTSHWGAIWFEAIKR